MWPVLAAELGLRAFIAQRADYYRYTPHWRERLDHSGVCLPGFPEFSMVEINADGERGDAPPAPGDDCYRALVVGGSAAECYHLDQDATWSAVVQRILSEPQNRAVLDTPRVHVGNIARAIVPVGQMTVMLQKILPRYRRLDAVVVMIGAADVVSWLEQGAPAAGPSSDVCLDRLFEQHPEKAWGSRPSETAVWRTLSQWNRRLRRPVVIEQGLGRWLPRVRKMRAEAAPHCDEMPDPTAMLENFEVKLGGLLQLLQKTADRVVVARQPWFGADPKPEEEEMFWNFGLGRPYKERVNTYFTPRAVDEVMRAMDERAARVASAAGVEQIDVGGRIEHSARTFYDELHFTPAGAEAVGRLVAQQLLRGH